MPLAQIYVPEGALTLDQKRAMIKGVTGSGQLLAARQLRTTGGDDGHFVLAFAPPSAGFARMRIWPPSVFSTSKAPVLRTRSLSLLNP
jgi:hypothetical protein